MHLEQNLDANGVYWTGSLRTVPGSSQSLRRAVREVKAGPAIAASWQAIADAGPITTGGVQSTMTGPPQ